MLFTGGYDMNQRVDFSMHFSRKKPIPYAIKNTIGTGLVIGMIESFLIAYTVQSALSTLEFIQLVVLTMLTDGLIVGSVCGLIAGIISPLIPVKYESDAHTWSVGIGGFLLYCWLLMPKVLLLIEQGRMSHAVGIIGCIFIFSGCTWYNALYWFRRDFARGVSYSWLPVVSGVSLCMIPIFLNIYNSRTLGNAEKTLDIDNNILVIAVDNLRYDALENMPKLQKFANKSLVFEDAISGTPNSYWANTSILTGIHALDNGILSDDLQVTTAAYRMSRNNYATFGFFSNPQFARYNHKDNLSMFFDVYDAQCSFTLPSLQKIQLFSVLNWSPTKESKNTACTASSLSSKTLDWVSKSAAPSFTYVQLSDLSGITSKELYIKELSALDTSIDELIRGIDKAAQQRKVMVAVVGTSGVMLGEKDIRGNFGLYEEMIHVPLIIRPIQGKKSIDNTESSLVGSVKKPVRIWDIYSTMMHQLNWDVNHKVITSGELVKKSASPSFHGYNEILINKEIVGAESDWVIGYRAGIKNTSDVYKITLHPLREEVRVISVPDDPQESENLLEEQPKIYQSTEALLQNVVKNLPMQPQMDWVPKREKENP
jgi:hypothetical protein